MEHQDLQSNRPLIHQDPALNFTEVIFCYRKGVFQSFKDCCWAMENACSSQLFDAHMQVDY